MDLVFVYFTLKVMNDVALNLITFACNVCLTACRRNKTFRSVKKMAFIFNIVCQTVTGVLSTQDFTF